MPREPSAQGHSGYSEGPAPAPPSLLRNSAQAMHGARSGKELRLLKLRGRPPVYTTLQTYTKTQAGDGWRRCLVGRQIFTWRFPKSWGYYVCSIINHPFGVATFMETSTWTRVHWVRRICQGKNADEDAPHGGSSQVVFWLELLFRPPLLFTKLMIASPWLKS